MTAYDVRQPDEKTSARDRERSAEDLRFFLLVAAVLAATLYMCAMR